MEVIFFTNTEVPYRVEFFNQLSKKINLTVVYERATSSNRNNEWAKSNKSNYENIVLKGINIKKEFGFDLRAIKYAFSKKYDTAVIGCINSPIQMLIIILFKIFKRKYIINLDGDCFINNKGIKNKIKKFFIKGANAYFIAGKLNAHNVSKQLNIKNVFYYDFSSLTLNEIKNNKNEENERNDTYLIVSRFSEVKGTNTLIDLAKLDVSKKYKIIGTGDRTNELKKIIEENNINNIEVIPFLQKKELYVEYTKCKALVLPSIKECWGLVVNEAASFGCPIISTYGSGAAKEFLHEKYDCFLANPGNENDLLEKLNLFEKLPQEKVKQYSEYLLNKSCEYTIENNVKTFIEMLDGVYYE